MGIIPVPIVAGRPAAHRPTSAAEDVITLAAGVWLLTGTYIDGWAHNNLHDLETFFTPWHAVLYSGFAACAVWIGLLVWRRRVPGVPWRGAVPAGYGAAAAGVVLFLVSGAADFTWHTVFGIEQDIKALFSPSHLGLAAGGFLILGAPFAAAAHSPEARSRARLVPAVVSAMLCGMVGAFILQEFAVYARHGLVQTYGGTSGGQHVASSAPSSSIIVAFGSFLVSTATLFIPLLLLSVRWRVRAWLAAVLAAVPSVALQAMVAFRDGWLVGAAAVGGLLVGVVWATARPRPERPGRLLTALAIAPVVFWGPYFGAVALRDGALTFSPELWGGMLVWTGLEMLALTALVTVGSAVRPSREIPGSAP
ncbi:hypothetical protein [Sinomonas sp. P10A9]|uniref:Uncharacterized protein n=1 Tax=Sinomonas puerhi TaxID=3238584 RepID=A0AB39L7L1_9MICC